MRPLPFATHGLDDTSAGPFPPYASCADLADDDMPIPAQPRAQTVCVSGITGVPPPRNLAQVRLAPILSEARG